MKLLAIVIAYNPDYEDLRKNIYSYCADVDFLVVWNNTPQLTNEECQKLLALNEKIENVEVRGDGENHLIAYPTNRVIEWGLDNGFTHILTMDQDSWFEATVMSKYRDTIGKVDSDIYGANIYAYNKLLVSKQLEPCPVDKVITSGSIYRLDLFNKIGLLREDYGIDSVDCEICYRTITRNYKVVVLPNIILNHTLGYPQKSIFGYITQNYSPFRLYYIARNKIWLSKEYPDLYSKNHSALKPAFIKHFIMIILSEKNKFAKIKALISGLRDGISS